MKRALLLLTLLLTAACSHGRTANFPGGTDLPGAGRVAVVRSDHLFGWWLPVTVTFDDAVIAHLRSGEHAVFPVPPGLHTVGVSDRGISVAVEPNRKYYFLISTEDSPAGFEIERLDPGRGEEWLSQTRPTP
jgi:hypothetical protein